MKKRSRKDKKKIQKLADNLEMVPSGANFEDTDMLIVSKLLSMYVNGTGKSPLVENYDSEPYRFCWDVVKMLGIEEKMDKLKLMEVLLHIQALGQKVVNEFEQ